MADVVVKSKVLPEEVVGIGVDFTSATILPVYEDGTALCMTEKFRNEPHAFVKLWKHHGAEKEAVFIDKIARERGEEWLDYYGGKISSEWTIPKVLETLRYAPEVYEEADYFLEAMDWIVWQLTGKLTASACAMGYKAFHFRDKFPSKDFFKALDPREQDRPERRYPFQESADRPDLRGYPEPPGQSLRERPGMRAGRGNSRHRSCLRGSDRL